MLQFPVNTNDPVQSVPPTDCIWKVAAPESNIIEINMVATAKDGPDIYVKSAAGGADEESLIVLKSNTFDILYSNANAVRIYADARKSVYLKISLTAYVETVCNGSDFQCQNQQCVNQTSVCDGIQDCPVLEDEYGCGDNCSAADSYMCPADRKCINSNLVCDGTGDCPGFTDEWDCGRCGDPYIELSSQPAQVVQRVSTVDCIWLVSTSSSRFPRIRLDILQLKIVLIHGTKPIKKAYLAKLTIGTGSVPYNESSVVRRLVRIEAYPPVLTFDGPSIWITVDVDNHPALAYQGLPSIELSIQQQTPINCGESQYTCSSGSSCIPRDRLCDGQIDCPEFDDEIGCSPCDGNQFKCTRSNGCLDPALLCDGEAQCPDRSDEGKCAPCGDNYFEVTSSSQTLTSPLYPYYYPNNIHCEWFVHGAPGYEIVIVFLYFYIELDYDYLLLESNLSTVVKLTGRSHLQRISLYTQDVKLIFVTDYIVNNPGFSVLLVQMQNASCSELEVPCNGTTHLMCILGTLVCNYEGDCPGATDEVYCPDVCGETKIQLGIDPHNITSPKFPDPYPLDISCSWEVDADEPDFAIKLEIHAFDLELNYDYMHLEVRKTNHSESRSSVLLTGTTKISTILYRSQFITMHFYSDQIIARGGFLITLQRIRKDYTLYKTCPNLFRCPTTGNNVDFCLQRDARCDGFNDCPNGEDEIQCGSVECDESEYQCDGNQQCLMWGSVCNGIPECDLYQDDETDCVNRGCPEHCTCFFGDKGLHVKCNNGWTLATVNKLVVITGVLDLIGGNITTLDEGIFKRLVNLKTLSLRNNNISRIALNTFAGLSNLTSLDISENHFTSLPGGVFQEQIMLTELGVRSVPIQLIEKNAFKGLKRLEKLVLMHGNGSIHDTHEITIEVEDGALTDLMALQTVYVDDYRLCCDFSAVLNHSKDCVTTQPQSPLFNCGRLIPNVLLQSFMWILGFSALIGNAVVIAWRTREDSGKGSKFVHSFLVLNLALSDFFMGVYMITIACVDVIMKEGYYLEATQWRNSALCKAAGIISVLSSEASVFFITLISIDRYMCIVHPFSRVRLRERSVWFTAALIWIVTLGLSVVPTVLITKDSYVYGLSDVCIGLPLLTTPSSYTFKEQGFGDQLTNDTFLIPVPQGSKPSWSYSIVLFLGVNLFCFLTVTFCYIAIFAKVKRSIRRVKQGSHKDEEIKMASKMAIIVGSDFLCWMPVIVLGILSQTSVIKIEPEVYAWLVVFVLPINSSLNPYLYTVVTVISRRRQSFPASGRKSSNAKHGVTDVAPGGKNNPISLTTKTGTLSSTDL